MTLYAIVSRDGRVLAVSDFAATAWLAALRLSHCDGAECVAISEGTHQVVGGRLVCRG